ncbi:MAG: hypothetical protein GWP19_03155 [Planctomycetia bacterium]|nr:hypothetical protein [Planctomycetia bacterium]
MKKMIAILFIIVFASSMIFAQGALPNKGDKFVGGRIGLGSYGAGVGFGGGFEMILQEDFLNLGDIPASLGVGGSFGYSTYKSGWSGYDWKYTNMVFLASVFYHADVLKNEKLDTYVKFSLGYNAGKVKYDGPSGYDYSSPSYGGVVTGSAIGARYFISKALAAVAELGWGFGFLRFGVDLAL